MFPQNAPPVLPPKYGMSCLLNVILQTSGIPYDHIAPMLMEYIKRLSIEAKEAIKQDGYLDEINASGRQEFYYVQGVIVVRSTVCVTAAGVLMDFFAYHISERPQPFYAPDV